MADWLDADQVLERLGIRPQTLYAYVSRGRIEAAAHPHDPRRSLYRASDVAALAQKKEFGVNLVELQPGAASSQRHWHTHDDEFVMVVSGELTLVTDEGETLMRAGDCAAFPAGRPNGHHLINKSWGNALFLAVGPNSHDDRAEYPDIDLVYDGATDSYTHRDGTPYPKRSAPAAASSALDVDTETLTPRVFRHD